MDGDRLIVVKATREQDPAYRATLLYFINVTYVVMRYMRKNLVEVFALVRVTLPK
jgi:hypothetical protein